MASVEPVTDHPQCLLDQRQAGQGVALAGVLGRFAEYPQNLSDLGFRLRGAARLRRA